MHYSEAWDELTAVAESCGIPVGETHAGRGAIRNDSPMLVGGTGHLGTQPAAHFGKSADLVICIGTRLADFVTGSNWAFQHPGVKFVSINVGAHDAYKIGAMPILADAREALRALSAEATAAGIRPDPAYTEEVASRKRAWNELLGAEVFRERSNERMSQCNLVGIINDSMREGDTLVAAAGTIPADLTKLFDASRGRNLHLEFGNSRMGYDIPAAIGVRLAQEGGEVLILMGDGQLPDAPHGAGDRHAGAHQGDRGASTSTTASSPSTATRRPSSVTASATSSGSATRGAGAWTTGRSSRSTTSRTPRASGFARGSPIRSRRSATPSPRHGARRGRA